MKKQIDKKQKNRKNIDFKIQFINVKKIKKMYKGNISPLNPTKDKYSNNNILPSNNNSQMYHQNNQQSTYQYQKSLFSANNNHIQYNRNQIASTNNYQPPLGPLSPNINKNPLSPTAKIKMFSNTLTLNKKNSLNNNNFPQNQNTQDNSMKQNKIFSKVNQKAQMFDLTQSIDLKCDEILQQSQVKANHKKQTPIISNNYQKQIYGLNKKTKLNIPILNFEQQIDDQDLKCDQILDIQKTESHNQSKKYNKLHPSNHNQSACDIQNNFTYMNRNTTGRLQNIQKNQNQGPLTPNYQRKKQIPLIVARKHTDRQSDPINSSNPVYNVQEKCRSFTNILSPNLTSQKAHYHQQNNEQQNDKALLNLANQDINSVLQQKGYLLRINSLLQAYKKRLDQVEQKNVFLQRQNTQLKKCLNQDNTNNGHTNLGGMTGNLTGAGRYGGK